jgi:hypothetical protein
MQAVLFCRTIDNASLAVRRAEAMLTVEEALRKYCVAVVTS